jgi:dTDP-4-amino-4,6-dideoxygalactose transaminase
MANTTAINILPACPGASYLAHKREIDQAIQRVLNGGAFILGQEVSAFEREFARFAGVPECIGVGSGTDALHLALRTLGIGPGDGVLTVSHTAVATVAAIELAGATPVVLDVDPHTMNLTPAILEDSVKKITGIPLKAVIVVHLYGRPADMPSIMAVASRYGLKVVEDCAQAHGALINGQQVGTWGHMAAYSFYPTKNLGALGDAGAVVTSDARLANRARALREYGWRERYVSELPGMNTRLDEIQAAILRVKLRSLNRDNMRRQDLSRLYDDALSSASVTVPQVEPHVKHVYHQYVIQSPRRDHLRAFLSHHGIGSLIHYPVPIHLQPAYRGRIVLGPLGLQHTETVCGKILSLPMYPELPEEQARAVADAIRRWSDG